MAFPTLSGCLISFLFYVSLLRGTNMGLFYPSSEFQLASIDYTPQTMMNGLLLVGIIVYFFLIRDLQFLVRGVSRVGIALVVTGITVTTIFSVDAFQSFKFILALVAVTLPCLLYSRHYSVEALGQALCYFIIATLIINFAYVLTLPQYGIMSDQHSGRWRGLFEHKNMAGLFFAIAPVFLLLLKKNKSPLFLLLKESAIVFSVFFMIKCQSSSAIIIFIALLLLCPFFYFVFRLSSVRARASVVMGFFTIILIVVSLFGKMLLSIILELTGRDATLTGRTGVWEEIITLVNQRPLLGYGPGLSERTDFMERIQSGVGWEVKGTHNGYLDLLINFGYPVTILLIGFIFSFFIKSFSSRTNTTETLMMAMVGTVILLIILLSGLSISATFFSRSFIWIFMVVAFLFIMRSQQVKNNTMQALR